jgi:hypothetical protein
MARGESKDLLTRLADAGEEAIHKLSEAPGADRLFGVVSSMRDRMDEMQKRIRGLEGIDRRVVELEQRVAKLEGGAKTSSGRKAATPAKRGSTRTRKTTSTSSTSPARSTTARRGSGSSKSG